MEVSDDMKHYAYDEYSVHQLKQIRLGLEDKVDISLYANVCVSAFNMSLIRLLLTYNINPNNYNILNLADEVLTDIYRFRKDSNKIKEILEPLYIKNEVVLTI